jgi:hypothetical protein
MTKSKLLSVLYVLVHKLAQPPTLPGGVSFPNAIREKHGDNVAPQDNELVIIRQQVAVLRETTAERDVPAAALGV